MLEEEGKRCWTLQYEEFNRIGEETRIARENQNLYTSDLKGGVSTIVSENSKTIARHTFYGK